MPTSAYLLELIGPGFSNEVVGGGGTGNTGKGEGKGYIFMAQRLSRRKGETQNEGWCLLHSPCLIPSLSLREE